MPLTILLVEDNPADADLLIDSLSTDSGGETWQVIHVERLSEAIHYVEQQPIDVVLLDLSLPDCHGLASIAQLHTVAPSLPIVMLTGRDDTQIAVQAVAQGAQDYLVKGHITTQLLTRAIHYAIERTQYLKQLQASENRFRAIVEDQTELIIRYLPDSTIQFANGAYCRYFGLQPEAIIGQRCTPAFFATDQVLFDRLINSMNIDHPTATTENRVVVNGEARWMQWNHRMLFDEQGQFTELQAVGRDITQVKEAEAQLRHSNERISLANAELARAARLKDEFLSNMSHELRTPLNSILGLAEALLEEVFGSITDKQRQFLQTIERSGQHLLALINDILDLSKIEAGKLELSLQTISLPSLCQSSLSFVEEQARQKRLQLTCELDETITAIEADQRRLLQVLVNLLSNAVKFTPDGGRVKLEVQRHLSQEAIAFRVSDTGIGIAHSQLRQIFQPFVQTDSSLSRSYEGTGLGLAIVQRIVDLHGGSIQVESEVGQGSCFTVLLPWHPLTHQEAVPLEPMPLSESKIQQVLVVEDSIPAANQIERYMAELGATSVIHPTGRDALNVALRVKPDVIVLDLLLPDCSGWDVLLELKAHPQTQTMPILVISVVDEQTRSLELGAAAHLLKPLSRQTFYQALTRIFAQVQPPSPETALIIPAAEVAYAPKILLAEDNEANIVTLLSYLEAHAFQVLLARNGLEAVQMTQQFQPDLILMDIQMPVMDGLEATRRIRAEDNSHTVPIIALTALAMPGDVERCLGAGATAYLAKPVKLKHLLEIITQLLAPQHLT